jgi:shikimate kinase
MKIFLVGLTGSGKSTLGKELAKSLKLSFVDLDDYIIEKEGKTIQEIFETYGEDYFRNLEHKSILELCKQKKIVIATGGGAACFHDNMTIMNIAGITLFLDVPPKIVADRLIQVQDRQNRPMLANKTNEQIVALMEDLYEKRLPYYNEAKLIVAGSDLESTHQATLHKILHLS